VDSGRLEANVGTLAPRTPQKLDESIAGGLARHPLTLCCELSVSVPTVVSVKESGIVTAEDSQLGEKGMDVAYISAISALAGSAVGGFTSTVTTWLTQRAQARAGQLAHEIGRREDLYRDFIMAASKTYGDALMSSEPQLPELVDLYALISRMRVLSEPRTVACADKIMLSIIDTYFSPNRSVRELGDLIKTGAAGIDPLREFSEAAREEVGVFKGA
jgi:hypothetical protein